MALGTTELTTRRLKCQLVSLSQHLTSCNGCSVRQSTDIHTLAPRTKNVKPMFFLASYRCPGIFALLCAVPYCDICVQRSSLASLTLSFKKILLSLATTKVWNLRHEAWRGTPGCLANATRCWSHARKGKPNCLLKQHSKASDSCFDYQCHCFFRSLQVFRTYQIKQPTVRLFCVFLVVAIKLQRPDKTADGQTFLSCCFFR